MKFCYKLCFVTIEFDVVMHYPDLIDNGRLTFVSAPNI